MNQHKTPVFELTGVCKEYRLERSRRVPVLHGLDLRVEPGEWLALTGPSGCGKTTLLHLLGALDTPNRGIVQCLGRNLARLSAGGKARLRRQTIGFMFQSYHLLPELTALENVMLPAMATTDRRLLHRRASNLLAQFGLEERLRHRPQELSGGEQQRAALARALINEPQILLADEPTGNLDRQAADTIMRLLQKLHREDGATIVMVTHDLSVAARASRVCRLENGGIAPAPPPPTDTNTVGSADS